MKHPPINRCELELELVDTQSQRQHKLGLALPQGFFVDSTGKVVREEEDHCTSTSQQQLFRPLQHLTLWILRMRSIRKT
jgi:hypothetical protein